MTVHLRGFLLGVCNAAPLVEISIIKKHIVRKPWKQKQLGRNNYKSGRIKLKSAKISRKVVE
jgi:hypothetical protein